MHLAWILLMISAVSSETTVTLLPSVDITLPEATEGSCARDGRRIGEGLKKQSLWAMKILDASAQGSTGVLHGNNWHLGDFDECMGVDGPVETQYCIVNIRSNISHTGGSDDVMNYVQKSIANRMWQRRDVNFAGLCLPRVCSAEELASAISSQLERDFNGTNSSYTVLVVPEMCTQSLEAPAWSANEICFSLAVSIFIAASIVGSIFGGRKSNNTLNRILKCFSWPENVERLFKVTRPMDEQSQPFMIFHALKVAAIVMVVSGHRSSIILAGSIANFAFVESLEETAKTLIPTTFDFVVDLFFFISAVLSTYYLCKISAKRSLNFFVGALSRLIRIAPAYFMLIWFQATVARRCSSGPMWSVVQKTETELCQNYWWANLLFINNYMGTANICLIHSWYLSCDMHFFLATLLLVPLMLKRPKIGLPLLGVLILITPAFPAVALWSNPEIDPILVFTEKFNVNPRTFAHLDLIYDPSHMRITVYLIGIAMGYFLWRKNNSSYKMPKITILMSLVATLAIMTAIFLPGKWYYSGKRPSTAFNILFGAFRRPLFACTMAILLVVHRFSPKDYISWVSSNQIVSLLSKLTFTIYLVHFQLIMYDWAQTRTPQVFGVYEMTYKAAADFLISAVISSGIFLTIECPVKRIFYEVVLAKKIEEAKQDFQMVPEPGMVMVPPANQ